MDQKQNILVSYKTFRKTIGFLGLLLPVIVVIGYWGFLASISHFYYTPSAVFLIAILTAFALLLISYRGYEKEKGKEFLSDNFITHVAGFAALMVVLFPTSCDGSGSIEICKMCNTGHYPLYGHNNPVINTIHFISAAIFFISVGWMSVFKFTKGAKHKKIYLICGYVIWISVLIIFIESIILKINISGYDTYILETVAVFAFGISWLVKGKTIEDIVILSNKLFKSKPIA